MKTVKLQDKTHKRLKRAAADRGIYLIELVEEKLNAVE